MFGDTFETVEDILNPTTTVYQTRKARNCADYMEMPELPRVKHFAGLKNQGATCYLNSLIQSYYMSPEFRNVILQLPLCKNTIDDSANFAKNESRNKFLLEFQKLFIQLQQLQSRATSTEPLTQSFGWNDGEQLYQQDVAEANKVLFETIHRSLSGTPYVLSNYYQGKLFHHITCLNCQNSHGHEEIFYDLNIQVQGNTNLHEGLFKCVDPELLDGANQYFCEECGFKVDALKGVKIRTLPPIVTITLNRYTYDYEKNARVKLNDRFEFPLEIEMGLYLENPKDNLIYELQGVLIHRGNAHGGHYHAYFRDLLDEGDWLNYIQEYWNEKETNQKKTDKEDFDNVQYAIDIQNPKVVEGWYNFNDNTVMPIPVNKIQEQFQGAESAYILIYRDRNLKPQKLENEQIPKYLIDYVNQLNQKIEQERQAYEEAKQHIIIQVADASILDINEHKLLNEKYESIQYKLKLSTSVSQLYQQIDKAGYKLLEFIEGYQTKLLHFPRYLENSDSTLEEKQVNHDSTWILVKDDLVIPQVGLEKVPYRLNLIINKKPQNFLLYTSTTLQELKELVFSLTGFAPNEQLLKVTQTQKIISDLLDETKLGELQLSLETQILVQKKVVQGSNLEKDNNNNNNAQKLDDDIQSIIVEREEDTSINRFYVNVNQTVQELIEFIKEQLGLTDARRLRNLNGRTLFCKTDLDVKLKELQDFREGGARLQLEKGEIPESGKISIDIKYGDNENFEIVADPRADQIQHLKKITCEKYSLNPDDFRFYKVDWLQVPSEAIVDETKTIAQCYLRDRDILILCDKKASIDCELIRFQIYSTTSGYPDDCVFKKYETIRKDSVLKDLKEMIISSFNLNVQIDCLRVRDINKNRFFGQVFRNPNQPLRKLNFQTNDIVYQVLDKPEQLNEDEMLLLIKERNPKNRVYINQREFVFKAPKLPKLQDLKDQIREVVGIGKDIQLELAKFVVFEFQWMHLDYNSLQNAQQNKGKQGKKQPKENQKNAKQQQLVDNLRKHPINLQEGDFIGYRLGDIKNDDFQTQEDNELRERMIAARKNKHDQFGKSGRVQNEKGFVVGID